MSVWNEDTDSLQAAEERAASWTAIILERLRVSGKRHVSKKVRAAQLLCCGDCSRDHHYGNFIGG